MPFRWPNTCQDVMLATEVAQRRPKCSADYEEICEGTFPIFSEDKKLNTFCSQGELVEKGSMALSQNTLKKIKRLLKGWLLKICNPIPPKDINAMLKSILVTTANGKPQTVSSRLPFAVNAFKNRGDYYM